MKKKVTASEGEGQVYLVEVIRESIANVRVHAKNEEEAYKKVEKGMSDDEDLQEEVDEQLNYYDEDYRVLGTEDDLGFSFSNARYPDIF